MSFCPQLLECYFKGYTYLIVLLALANFDARAGPLLKPIPAWVSAATHAAPGRQQPGASKLETHHDEDA